MTIAARADQVISVRVSDNIWPSPPAIHESFEFFLAHGLMHISPCCPDILAV